MYPVSSDFLKAIKSTQRSFVLKLEIDTAFDTFYLTEKDVDMGSLKLEEGCVSGDSLELGAAKAALFDISINNRDGRFDDVQFNGGIMKPFIGLELPNGNIEWVPLGVFNIDEVSRPTTSVSLGGSDNLILFDRDFADVPVSFPTTNKQLLLAICNRVGVPLATTNFLNDDYVVQKAPDSAMSCRDVVKCIAELAAGFAQCDRTTGALKIMQFQNPGCVQEADIDGGDFLGIDHTASGSTVEYDGPFGTKITSIVVTGKTTQEGTGDPSPDNVRPIHGVTYAEKWDGTLLGNRNLLLNSATIPGLHGWCPTVRTPAVDQGNGFYRIPLNSNVIEILQDSAITTVNGNQYTESFYFRTDSTTLSFYITFFEKNNNKHNSVKATIQNLGNGLYRAYATATVGDTAIRSIDVNMITFADGTYIDIGMPKFESGTIVTDYSVAPEDLPSYQKIVFPRELFTDDCYDIIKGQGQAKQNLITLDGTEAWFANLSFDTQAPDYLHVYTYINDRTPTSRVLSSHFPTVYDWRGNLSGNFIYSENGHATYVFIQKALLPTPDIAGLKSWLAANPVTVLYELATPQTITGTPQRILTEGHTVITNDADAQMQVGYNTMTGDDVDGGDFTWYNTKTTDGGAFVMPDPVVELGPSNRFDFKIDDNPVTITGIVYEAEDQDYVIGDRTYALHISDNALIQGDPTEVLNSIADVMIGFTYLPFTSSWQGNPALHPGDIIQQTDRKGVQYRTIVTNSTYAYRGVCNLSAKGASEIAHSYQSKQTKKATQLLRLIHEKEVKIDSLSQAILNATNLISGALGGHWINGDELPDEKYHGNVFIADNKDITKAKKIWRWNLGGFGHSNNGVDGPYTAAITADDSIVANIITASMIKTGRLQSIANPNVYFDLDKGILCASRLVSSENGSTDVYAKIGTVSWADGTTSKGLSLNSAKGILAYFSQREADGAIDHGLEIMSLGPLHIRSDTGASTQNNVLQMYNNSNHQGNIVFQRATGKGSTENVFLAVEGYTAISHNGCVIAIDHTGPFCSNGATGDIPLRKADGGIYILHLSGGFVMNG